MARIVTRGEGLRILAESLHELKFTRTPEEALYAFKRACKYKGLTDPHYCGSRSCSNCNVQCAYYRQLHTINFAKTILSEVNEK